MDDLKLLAAQRLKTLLGDLRFCSTKALADGLGRSERAIYKWKTLGLDIENARKITRLLGLRDGFFHDPAARFQDRGPRSYLPDQPAQGGASVISFTGTTTLMLAEFIRQNPDALAAGHVRLHTIGHAATQHTGQTLRAFVDGYQRTITTDSGVSLGGINAVLEERRLEKIEFVLAAPMAELRGDKGSFPCLTDADMDQRGQSVLDVLERDTRPREMIHYCLRKPGLRSFALLIDILARYRHNFAICACVFDASKAFAAHFMHHPGDALIMQAQIEKFLRDFAESDEAADAVSYAIEALPFCAHPRVHQRQRASDLLDQVMLGVRKFQNATQDQRLAAQAAQAYLPHVAHPAGFVMNGHRKGAARSGRLPRRPT